MRAAMKARDELITSTLRMALAAVRTAEVAGKAKRELSDDEVLAVLTKEAKKRREAADRVRRRRAAPSRPRRSGRGGGARPLPAEAALRRRARRAGVRGARRGRLHRQAQMGPAMKAAQAAVAGRAEGGRVAAEVRDSSASDPSAAP